VLALQKLSACPYIVNFERAWQEDGYLYTQAELCELGNLKKVIERVLDSGSSFPDSSVWKVAHDVGEGLHFIHSHSFVHLDIKPSNVFICLSGRMKIGDFGMATAFGDRNGQEGDAAYMALELLNMQERKPSADIFSLGLTLYEMAVGLREVPVTGPLWHALREGAAPPLPMHRCTVLRDIIVAMMDRCEENRPSANFVRKEPCAAAAREADQFILDQGRAAAQKWGVLVGGGSCSAILEEDEQRFATTHQACGTPLRCGIRPETPVPPTPAPLAWSCSGRQQSK
jgi:serine/threonine protein kinase